MSRKGLRIAEVLAILLVILLGGILGLNVVRDAWFRATGAESMAVCAARLKHWASVLAMYADESKDGLYPPVITAPTVNFALDLSLLCPQYLSDVSCVVCPSATDAPPRVADLKPLDAGERRRVLAGLNQSYSYLGWVFDRMEDVPEQSLAMDKLPPALAAMWNRLPDTPAAVAADPERRVCRQMALTLESAFCRPDAVDADGRLETPDGNMGGTTVHRLGKGAERMLLADSNASPQEQAKLAAGIPVVLDTFVYSPMFSMFNHLPGGSNVLFLDGHAAFCRFPGPGPVNRSVGSLLDLLAVIKGCNP